MSSQVPPDQPATKIKPKYLPYVLDPSNRSPVINLTGLYWVPPWVGSSKTLATLLLITAHEVVQGYTKEHGLNSPYGD